MTPDPPGLPRPREVEVQVLLAVFRNCLDAIVTMDQTGAITGWNPAAEVMFGWPTEEAAGKTLSETIIPDRYRQAHERGLAKYLFSGEGPVLGKVLDHLTAIRRDGQEFPVELAISRAWQESNEHVIFAAFVRDISGRKLEDRVTTARFAVTRTLAFNRTWHAAAPALLEALSVALEWDLADVFEINDAEGTATYGTGWATADLDAQVFVAASRETLFVRGRGLPGRVWETGLPAGIPELGADPNFPRQAQAEMLGLRSGAAFPIVEAGAVTGIVELFRREPITLDPRTLEVLADIGNQLGQFRTHERADPVT